MDNSDRIGLGIIGSFFIGLISTMVIAGQIMNKQNKEIKLWHGKHCHQILKDKTPSDSIRYFRIDPFCFSGDSLKND